MIYLELVANLVGFLKRERSITFEFNGKNYTLRVTEYGKLILN